MASTLCAGAQRHRALNVVRRTSYVNCRPSLPHLYPCSSFILPLSYITSYYPSPPLPTTTSITYLSLSTHRLLTRCHHEHLDALCPRHRIGLDRRPVSTDHDCRSLHRYLSIIIVLLGGESCFAHRPLRCLSDPTFLLLSLGWRDQHP